MLRKPDRLARNTAELLTIEQGLTARNVGLVILSMCGERIDTRNPTSKLILTILAGVATWEREIMLERQREGIVRRKARGAIWVGSRRSIRSRSGGGFWLVRERHPSPRRLDERSRASTSTCPRAQS